MIVFDLSCNQNHCFEGWFRNSDDFSAQLHSGLLTCPICGSDQIVKKLSANRVNLGKAQQHQELSAVNHEQKRLLQTINAFIENNFEDVGHKFTEQAIKMHYGEIEERNIKGTATAEETIELQEEGIDIIPLPATIDKDKLN